MKFHLLINFLPLIVLLIVGNNAFTALLAAFGAFRAGAIAQKYYGDNDPYAKLFRR